jgi:long-subunit fatty acid transport protein
MLSVGIDLRIVEPLKFSLGYHTYFDSKTGWAEEADPNQIDYNFWELAVGLEWNLTKKFLLSAGYLRAETGANQNYQSNLGFSLTTNTFAFGGAYAFNDTFKLNLGGYYVMYEEMSYQENYADIPYKETYLKNTFAIALGLDIAIHSKK